MIFRIATVQRCGHARGQHHRWLPGGISHSRMSSVVSAAAPRKPVLFVVGTTGSGKSKLSIDIALAVNEAGGANGESGSSASAKAGASWAGSTATGSGAAGTDTGSAPAVPFSFAEIVNADVIQMYAGLDTASAKVPMQDRAGVPHHLMSFLAPQDVFTVRDFRALACKAIEDIHGRGGLPIVTGGTLYYIQSLLSSTGTLEQEEEASVRYGAGAGSLSVEDGAVPAGGAVVATSGGHASPWHRLLSVDPVMARRLHPNDHRKIARALEAYDRTGKTYSQLLADQAARLATSLSSGASADGTGPSPVEADRQSTWQPLVLWTRVEPRPGAALDQRLDDRVRAMAAGGLIQEMWRLRQYLDSSDGQGLQASSTERMSLGLSDDRPTDLTTAILQQYQTESGRTFAPPTQAAFADTGPHALDQPSTTSAIPSSARAPSVSSSYTGLLQAIGYKEFTPLLDVIAERQGAGTSGRVDGGAVPGGPGSTPASREPAASAFVEPSHVTKGVEMALSLRHAAASIRAVTSAAAAGAGVPDTSSRSAGGSGVAARATDPGLQSALVSGFRALADGTHQYARKQDRWIRNRFAAKGIRLLAIDTDLRPGRASASTSSPASAGMGNGSRSAEALEDDSKLTTGSSSKRRRRGSESKASDTPEGSVVEIPRPGDSAISTGLTSTRTAPSGTTAAVALDWQSTVTQPCNHAVLSWLSTGLTGIPAWDSAAPSPSTTSGEAAQVGASSAAAPGNDLARIQAWEQLVCDVCGGRVLNGVLAIKEHLAGRSHAKMVARAKRMEQGLQGAPKRHKRPQADDKGAPTEAGEAAAATDASRGLQ